MPATHDAKIVRQHKTSSGTHEEWTGLVLLHCNCGHDSGWVDPDTIIADIYEHAVRPGMAKLT